jgi:hypothetical protein
VLKYGLKAFLCEPGRSIISAWRSRGRSSAVSRTCRESSPPTPIPFPLHTGSGEFPEVLKLPSLWTYSHRNWMKCSYVFTLTPRREWMRMGRPERVADLTEEHGGSTNLPTSVAARIKCGGLWLSLPVRCSVLCVECGGRPVLFHLAGNASLATHCIRVIRRVCR